MQETGGKLGPFNKNAYLPFGAGGRKCAGYKFAEQEMTLVMASLFQCFTITRPPGEGPLLARTGATGHGPLGKVKVLLEAREVSFP
jgi:cytochrome P450